MGSYRTTRRVGLGATLVAAAIGTCVLLAAERDANAQVNAGGELGMAYRSSDPSLRAGFAWGLHAEYKIIPELSVGAYLLEYDLSASGDKLDSPVNFLTLGGRVRFWMPLPDKNIRPYAYLGLGRTGVTIPTEYVTGGTPTGARQTAFEERNGRFVEIPIGLGCGYQIFKIMQLHADLAFRPGVAFAGSAYEGPAAFDEPKMGLTFMAGASMDL